MMGEIRSLFDLSGKTALVTGGGSGLGREFCTALAEFGATVVCADLIIDRAKETCEMIKGYGSNNLALEADISDYNQVKKMHKMIEDTFGSLDILVNNAGIAAPGAVVEDMNVDNWLKVINVNLNGTFYCMKEALKLMSLKKKGSIINISSVLGLMGLDPDVKQNSHYVAAKAGIIGLTKQGAAEYGRNNIRVNSIAPGWFLSTRLAENWRKIASQEELKTYEDLLISKTPMKRTGDERELCGLLIYLASDASSFVTGQIIAVDGGWTCCH